MVQYLYAKNKDGKLFSIDNVKEDNSNQLFCPSCGKEMVAVLGRKREHHFRHKGETCSYESYLHMVTKELVKWRFDNSHIFEVAYYATTRCPKQECPFSSSNCNTENSFLYKVDLKKYYDTCEIECTHNGFRADVKLFKSDNLQIPPTFIEVLVSHKCTPEKLSSGIRIIEISVANERDALMPLEERESIESNREPNKVQFHNFKRSITLKKTLSRFFIYKDNQLGYLRGAIEQECAICLQDLPCKDISLYEMQYVSEISQQQKNYHLWLFGMFKAIDSGFDVRDCRICQNVRECIVSIPIRDSRTGENCTKTYRASDLAEDANIAILLANRCSHFQKNWYLRVKVMAEFKKLKFNEIIPECNDKP